MKPQKATRHSPYRSPDHKISTTNNDPYLKGTICETTFPENKLIFQAKGLEARSLRIIPRYDVLPCFENNPIKMYRGAKIFINNVYRKISPVIKRILPNNIRNLKKAKNMSVP